MPEFQDKFEDKPVHAPKHHEHDKPKDKPQDEKTAGDLRKEDQEAEIDNTQVDKQGMQDEADEKALQDYAKEHYPPVPAEDPIKDMHERRAEEKKQHDHGAEQEAKDQKQRLADDKAAQKHKL